MHKGGVRNRFSLQFTFKLLNANLYIKCSYINLLLKIDSQKEITCKTYCCILLLFLLSRKTCILQSVIFSIDLIGGCHETSSLLWSLPLLCGGHCVSMVTDCHHMETEACGTETK